MGDTTTCSLCGSPTKSHLSGGGCPACLLKLGVAAGSSSKGRRFHPPAPAVLATLIPDLTVDSLIGVGGMGAVYRGRQLNLDRTVAVKVVAAAGPGDDPAFDERFLREARALARLRHPGIVSVYSAGRTDQLLYILMEYVDGVSLREVIRDGALSGQEAMRLVVELCDALQYAHDRGVVHRDIKPENILVDTDGHAKLIDFGVARLASSRQEALEHATVDAISTASGFSAAADDLNLTEAHHRLGTARYMPPEQASAPSEADHRADIYSLGITFHEMLTGTTPTATPAPATNGTAVDRRLTGVIRRCIQTEPQARYQAITHLRRDVEHLARGRRWGSRGLVAAAIGIIGAVGLFVLWQNGQGGQQSAIASPTTTTSSFAGSMVPASTSAPATVPATEPSPDLLPGPLRAVLPDPTIAARDGNYCLELDGRSAYVEIPSLSRNEDSPVTIEAWIRPVRQGTMRPRAILVMGGEARCQVNHYPLGIGGHDQSLANAELMARAETAGQRNPMRAYHIAYVVDKDEGRLYVDGVLTGTAKRTGPRLFTPAQVPHSWIGGHPELNDVLPRYNFRGWVDEIRFSSGARYTENFSPLRKFETDANTLALYHCNEGSGDVLKDDSGNNHNGRTWGTRWVPATDLLWPPSVSQRN